MSITVPSGLGGLFLAIGLIVLGLALLVSLAVPSPLVGVWALLTGILLLIGR